MFPLLPLSISAEGFADLEKDFEKNELNSAVYLISMAMQISNFAVNYKVPLLSCFLVCCLPVVLYAHQGHPFMASLTENKPLLVSLVISAVATFVLASGIIPEISATFEITPFSDDVRETEKCHNSAVCL